MYVLGIETSCDETAASVVKDGRRICSNIVSSSLDFHKKYGGVVPEIASRMQLEVITEVVDSALGASGIKIKDIGLISVTNSPGLLGSLLVGISFAKALAFSLGVPLLGVNHLYSHIYASFLNKKTPSFPFVALIVSGGHTSLFFVEDFDKIKLVGSTLDDACGEAFDKVAKVLGLSYPGGPVIEELAKKGSPRTIKFSCSNTNNPLDFSFSGIKTAVLYYVNRQTTGRPENAAFRRRPAKCSSRQIKDICASFQQAAIDTLINKSLSCAKSKRVKAIVVGGGVAANSSLKEEFIRRSQENGLKCYFPPKELCMDNAAMVAGLGYQLFKKGYRSDISLNADLN